MSAHHRNHHQSLVQMADPKEQPSEFMLQRAQRALDPKLTKRGVFRPAPPTVSDFQKDLTEEERLEMQLEESMKRGDEKLMKDAQYAEEQQLKREIKEMEARVLEEYRQMRINQRADIAANVTVEDKVQEAELLMEQTSSTDNPLNAPMIISWIYKNITAEPVVLNGMVLVNKHFDLGEGCRIFAKHGIWLSLHKCVEHYKSTPNIMYLMVSSLSKLLDCNLSRDILLENLQVLHDAMQVSHLFQKSRQHLECSMRCIVQCMRKEEHRAELFKHNMIPYLIGFTRKFPSSPIIIRALLKIFSWSSSTPDRMQILYDLDAVKITVKCMQKHPYESEVLAPAVIFLTRAAKMVPQCFHTILKLKAIPTIISALQALISHQSIQLDGLKLIQSLSKTREGWDQISSVPGGWQSLAQGTTMGDALMHDLPGDLNNPGWCIGETPHLPDIEKIRMANQQAMMNGTRAKSKLAWTVTSLREFMGLSMKGQTLAINIEQNETYFDLITMLDLLPSPGEEREAWFQRVKAYERESDIQVEDMVLTVIEMKKREAKRIKELEENKGSGEYVKPLYVTGQKVTADFLLKNDKSVAEMFEAFTGTKAEVDLSGDLPAL